MSEETAPPVVAVVPPVVSEPVASAPPSPTPMLCIPGVQQSCACGGGTQGYQVCAAGGLSFMACVCPRPAPTTPTDDARPLRPSEDEERPRQPISFTDRPLTLPRFTLRAAARVDVWKGYTEALGLLSSSYPIARLGGAAPDFVMAAAGAHIGITDDFEAGIEPLPVRLAPRAQFGDMRVSLSYRFARGSFDMGVGATLSLPTGERSTAALQFRLPMRWRGRSVRTDLALLTTFPIRENNQLFISLPLMTQFAINETAHLGFTTGLSLIWTPGSSASTASVGRTVALPLGIAGGFTVRGRSGPLVDIDSYLQFPTFLNTFRDRVDLTLESYEFGVSVSLFHNL